MLSILIKGAMEVSDKDHYQVHLTAPNATVIVIIIIIHVYPCYTDEEGLQFIQMT